MTRDKDMEQLLHAPPEFDRLNEIRRRYRRSVHQVFTPASVALLSKTALRLGMDLPEDLLSFIPNIMVPFSFEGF